MVLFPSSGPLKNCCACFMNIILASNAVSLRLAGAAIVLTLADDQWPLVTPVSTAECENGSLD